MEKIVKPARVAALFLFIAALVTVYLVALYKLQIVEGKAYYEESVNNIVSHETVAAARGSLMDRYGRVLVENRICNNLLIDESELFGDGGDEAIAKANAAILELCNTVTSFGDSYTDTLPITMEPPFEYTEMTDIQRAFLEAYLRGKNLDKSTTAVELMSYMRGRYKIDNSYTAEETRIIAGVRYEINGRYTEGFSTSAYVFAEDVSMELITTLMENDIPGFDVVSSYVREYNTRYAAHILGYIGMMNGEEYKTYAKQGYKLNAQVGKSGAELAFEQYLHGTDGEARLTRTATGVTTSTVYTEEPEPGNHVYLTIDIGFQEVAENALNSFITNENAQREAKNAEIERYGGNMDDYKQLITGGAAVAVDVKTGEPLAIATWPSYDPAEIISHYSEIASAKNSPLYNRALQGTYAPGSTFKPCVAIAALCEGKIDTTTTIQCEGIFKKYEDAGYAPACWIWNSNHITHGMLTLPEAITVSCNYYFYTLGDYLQISLMAKYAKAFGLGEHTGIELYEETGHMSSDEYMQQTQGRDMYAGDTIAAAIGQSVSLFSPLQLAEYCAALANNGERNSASILKTVRSFDFSETVYEREKETLSAVEAPQEYYDAVHEGMYGVANDRINGAAYEIFAGAPYTVAAKTGTAQTGQKTNTGLFICYAPYDDPEVAIAVAVEKGSAGASVAKIARQMLDYYFSFKDSTMALESEGVLLK